jgi:hypothetical protein
MVRHLKRPEGWVGRMVWIKRLEDWLIRRRARAQAIKTAYPFYGLTIVR